jgi:telomerase Cajal body protein 1
VLTKSTDPVSSTVLHNSGSVIATCSGQRVQSVIEEDTVISEEDDGIDEKEQGRRFDEGSHHPPTRLPARTTRTPDNSINVWSI